MNPLEGDRRQGILSSEAGDAEVAAGTCAVLVTYNPDPLRLEQVIEAAVRQVDDLLILDNGSPTHSWATVQSLVATYLPSGPGQARVTLRSLGTNRGLPVAFNEAIDFARARHRRFLLLLDHDSILAEEAMPRLLQTYERLVARTAVGAVEAFNEEPTVLPTDDFLDGYLHRRDPSLGEDVTQDFLATNSGLLIPLSVIDRVGGFDESYFVDAVDFEFGLRLRAQGLPIYRVRSARILHQRGEPAEARIGRTRWRLRRVAPQRHYFVGRETMRLGRQYVRRFPLIGLFLLSMPFREAGLVVLFYPERRAHLRALALGVLHAVTGVRGPYTVS
jgi:rhamnosyltransferase